MLKAYKYRIYPNNEQKEFLAKTFGCTRFVWNKMLEEKLEVLKQGKKIPRITPAKYKEEFTFLKEVDSLALANVQLQLEKAFRNHFKKPKHFGVPKFKKKKDKQSYTTNNQNGTVRIDCDKQLLFVPKLKSGIKIKLHRKFVGTIKSVTISKTTTGNYYASVLVETDNVQNKVKEPTSKVCGIDMGVKTFLVMYTDNGIHKIDYSKYYIKAEKRLKRLQRRLSRKEKGSKNREKARLLLAKQHEYVKNSRLDFLHKLSKIIIDDNQVIVVEDLTIKNMYQFSNLSKRIQDSAFGTFLRFLEYKAEHYGRTLIFADRWYPSSKTCSVCGYYYKEMDLSIREWECPECGTLHDRDENASKNLYKIGVTHLMSGRVGTIRTQACGETNSLCEAGSSHFYK